MIYYQLGNIIHEEGGNEIPMKGKEFVNYMRRELQDYWNDFINEDGKKILL